MGAIDKDALRQVLKEDGRSARAVSLDAELGATAIKDILSGKSRDPSFSTVTAIAAQLGVDPSAFWTGPAGEPGRLTRVVAPISLPLLGPIQAGAWLAIDDTGQDEVVMLEAALDRRYPHAAQWLREVRGDSMNALGIGPGDTAHIVDFQDSGVNLNTGMVVEVSRTRASGALREITLKQAEVTPDGILLWPRSTNPRWKDPIELMPPEGGDIEVQITGLLVSTIKRFG